MLELDYKHRLMALMRGAGFKVQAHEDLISKYISDLSFSGVGIDGWIEVKFLQDTPSSLGSIPHYTYGQQEWLTSRGAVGGGHCYLLVGTPDENYLWWAGVLTAVRDLPWADAVGFAWRERRLGDIPQAIKSIPGLLCREKWGGGPYRPSNAVTAL